MKGGDAVTLNPSRIDGERYVCEAACPINGCLWHEVVSNENVAIVQLSNHLAERHTIEQLSQYIVVVAPRAVVNLRLVPER